MQGPRVYTVEEVATELRLTKAQVMRLLASGKLSGLKVGRVWRIAESSVQKLIDSSADKSVTVTK